MESWNIAELDVQPHKPVVLSTDKEARVIALNLPAGERLQDHQTYERAYLIVVSGEIQIDSTTGGAGFLAEFDPNERREIKATQDALLILILGPWPGEGHSRERSSPGVGRTP